MSDRTSARPPGRDARAARHADRRTTHAKRTREGGRPPVLGSFAWERALTVMADGKTGMVGALAERAG